jgi:hypothetical protein
MLTSIFTEATFKKIQVATFMVGQMCHPTGKHLRHRIGDHAPIPVKIADLSFTQEKPVCFELHAGPAFHILVGSWTFWLCEHSRSIIGVDPCFRKVICLATSFI